MRECLRPAAQHNITLIGPCSLGQASARSRAFADHGFNIAVVFDCDPGKVCTPIDSLHVQGVDELASAVREKNIIVGVLAVPESAAQTAADALVAAGVKIIFNYADT